MSACIVNRLRWLKKNAAERCHIKEEDVHIGHVALQAMLEEPDMICQIDAATHEQESNESVARRACGLASAMFNFGLKVGDSVIIIGNNRLDLCIPYYACHFGGYSMCSVDTRIGPNDFTKIVQNVHPKLIFYQKSCEEKVKQAIKINQFEVEVVIFDDKEADIQNFIKKWNGDHVNYRPAIFDTSKTTAWLMLTSGTTGTPKVAVIPFDTLLNAITNWWIPCPDKVERCLVMGALQWVSGLIYFITGPIKGFTRVQSSEPLTPQSFIALIHKYKPSATVWAPFLLRKFLDAAENVCDLSSFKFIAIGGGTVDKPVLDKLKKKCNAIIYVVYGMTELLTPIFQFNDKTPFGSCGRPLPQYQFKLMGDDGQPVEGIRRSGELWVKGNSASFFKGYLHDLEETRKMLTEDGWFKTGDIFYKDEENYYYFVERKRLLIRHYGFKISPLEMEEIIKRHPGVADAVAVGIPSPDCLELPVAAILRKNGEEINPQEIFDLLTNNLDGKLLNGGFFFIDSIPVTPSGKVHRANVKEMALTAQKTIFSA